MKKWSSQGVRELRWKLGWSQAEFARHLGCRQQTISEWENGAYEPQNAYSKLLSHLEGQSAIYTERIKTEAVADALLNEDKASQISHSEIALRIDKSLIAALK